MQPKFKETIHSALVMAFTIAAALIWKDVIVDLIEMIVPSREELFYKFLAAAAATIVVILLIYLLFQTEYETGEIIKKAENMASNFRKKKAVRADSEERARSEEGGVADKIN